MSGRFALASAIVLALASPTAQQTTFRTSSNVVAVDASVYDKNGQPVTNLTAADFRIFEDGVAQPVQTAYLVSADPAIVNGTPPASNSAAGGDTALPRRELRGRVFIFVFDLSHQSADGYKRSRAAVEAFLKDSALPSDLVGVVAGAEMLTNKISADKAPILAAMKSMKGPNLARVAELHQYPRLIDDAEALAIARGDQETVTRAVRRACSEQPDDCSGRGGDEIVRQQIEAKARQFTAESQRDSLLTLSTLLTLTNGLGRFPGTKQVLLLSDGFFTGELESQLRAVVEVAARSNVRFSTLDSRGLGKDPRMQDFMGAQPLTAPGDMSPLSLDQNADALASLAIDTGGEMIQNRNDLKPGIDMIARTTGTYYVLGYAPSKPLNGSYRKIEVRVVPPGLTVRARKGYVALAQNSPPGAGGSLPSAEGSLPSAEGSLPSAGGSLPSAGGSLPSAGGSLPAAGGSAAAAVVEPPATGTGLSALAGDSSVAGRDPAAKVGERPNSRRNVDELTKVAPTGGTSAVQKLADAGWDAYSKGDVVTAQKTLAKAVASGPSAPWVSYSLGYSEYALGRYDAAIAAWTRVRDAVPEFMPVYFDIADAYINLGRNVDALSTLRVCAKRWPNEPEAQNALGTLLVRRGALDEAIDVFTAITVAKSADSLGFFNLARSYHLRYLRLQRNIAAARLGGKTAIGEDDRQKAVALYQRYLALGGPYETEARQALATLDWK